MRSSPGVRSHRVSSAYDTSDAGGRNVDIDADAPDRLSRCRPAFEIGSGLRIAADAQRMFGVVDDIECNAHTADRRDHRRNQTVATPADRLLGTVDDEFAGKNAVAIACSGFFVMAQVEATAPEICILKCAPDVCRLQLTAKRVGNCPAASAVKS